MPQSRTAAAAHTRRSSLTAGTSMVSSLRHFGIVLNVQSGFRKITARAGN